MWTLTGHQGQVTAVATAVVAGRAVAVTGSRDGTAQIWDLATGREACPSLHCRTDARTALTVEVDRVATATLDGLEVALLLSELAGEQRLLLLDLATGSLTGECVRVAAVAELAGRSVVLTLEDDRTLRLWNVATGEELGSSVPAQLLAGSHGYPAAVRVELGGAVRTWDLAGNELDSAPVDADEQAYDPQAVAVVVDGRLVACAFDALDIDHLHDGDTAVALLGDLAAACGHRSGAPVRVSQSVVVAGRPVTLFREYGGALRVWDRVAGSQPGAQGWVVTTDELRGQPLRLPAEVPGQDYWFWQLADSAPALAADAGRSAASVLGTFVVAGRAFQLITDAGHVVRVRDTAAGAEVGERPFLCHEARIRAGALAEVNGQLRAVTAALDRSVRLWEVAGGRQINGPLKGHTGQVWDVATAIVDGQPVAVTASADHTVRVWELAQRRVRRHTEIRGHNDVVLTTAMTTIQSQPAVVTASADKTLRTWDLATGQQLGEPLTGHADWVTSVTTTTLNGHPIAVTAGRDGTIRTWSLPDGRQYAEPLPCPAEPVRGLATAVLGTSTHLITTSGTETVSVRDLATGGELVPPLRCPVPVQAALAAPDGGLVVCFGLEIAMLSAVDGQASGRRATASYDLSARDADRPGP
ncbi:hypothetical protein GCM10010207_82910 [Streptomyces atratus]|uniref:WD40 repeat domain-containing protein n=1 Tax=Streptomyces atratus TaxID=1893 RepID=UPI00198FB97E|nr:WD40 repeat domain-containing protein [Streptomyces atratus]GGT72324.1 hypothetical protein GCM10010207_82910 [Streptomyces atratus]